MFILAWSKTIIMMLALKLKLASNGFTRVLAVEFNHYLGSFFIMISIQFWVALSQCGTWIGLFSLAEYVSCSVSPADLLFASLPVWNINILICCSTLWNPSQTVGTKFWNHLSLSTPTPPSVPWLLPVCWRFLLVDHIWLENCNAVVGMLSVCSGAIGM